MEKKLNIVCNTISAILIVIFAIFFLRSMTTDNAPKTTATNIPAEISNINEETDKICDIVTRLDKMGTGTAHIVDMLYELEDISGLPSEAKELIGDIIFTHLQYCEGVPNQSSEDLHYITENIYDELLELEEYFSSSN